MLIPLIEQNGSHPFARLTADQAARAKGVVFVTDEAGAQEAEKDKKRFSVTTSIAMDGRTFACVFVLQDDGTMSEKQRELSAQLKVMAAFEQPKAETKNADGDRLTAEIVIPKEVTDVLGEKKVFEAIIGFLGENSGCTTKIEMHYRDAKTLTEALSNDACRDDNTLRLTLSFDNPLPKDFEKDVNAEAALQEVRVSVKSNTVTFKKATIDENEVKTYFGTHASATIPKTFATVCDPEKLLEWVLNRPSDQPLRLDMSAYADDAVGG